MGYDASAEISRQLPAPPDRIWSALTEPAALTAWYWPASLDPQATYNPRPAVHDRVDAETAEAYRAGWTSCRTACLDRLPAFLGAATGAEAGSR
jgi:uncharacterized protein YndB with AHSA1/START domain